jgi:hypothetical protein
MDVITNTIIPEQRCYHQANWTLWSPLKGGRANLKVLKWRNSSFTIHTGMHVKSQHNSCSHREAIKGKKWNKIINGALPKERKDQKGPGCISSSEPLSCSRQLEWGAWVSYIFWLNNWSPMSCYTLFPNSWKLHPCRYVRLCQTLRGWRKVVLCITFRWRNWGVGGIWSILSVNIPAETRTGSPRLLS